MEVTYQIFPDLRCIVVTWGGKFDAGALRSMFQELPKHPDFCPGLNWLSDLRAVALDPTYDEISGLVQRLKPLGDPAGLLHPAILDHAIPQYGIFGSMSRWR